jgi:hypothetical protein
VPSFLQEVKTLSGIIPGRYLPENPASAGTAFSGVRTKTFVTTGHDFVVTHGKTDHDRHPGLFLTVCGEAARGHINTI